MFRRLITSYRASRQRSALYKEQHPFFWMMQRENTKTLTLTDQMMIANLQYFCPLLLRDTCDAIDTMSAKDLGIFLSLIYRTSMAAALVLLQRPNESQLQAYCNQLYSFGVSHLHQFTENSGEALMAWSHEIPLEIAAFIRDYQTTRGIATQLNVPAFATETFFQDACADQRKLTLDFLDTLMNKIRTPLHIKFNDRTRSSYTWVKMASAFYKDQDKRQLIPDPDLREVQASMDAHDAYVATGERVKLDDFCKPLATSYVPAEVDCVICSEKLAEGGTSEGCVVTVCAHYFHKVCLDTWVNEAAQQSSNDCPLCRMELCEARPRRPV